MQSVGNTYATDKVNLAVSGKGSTSSDATAKIDFSVLLNNISSQKNNSTSSALNGVHSSSTAFATKLNSEKQSLSFNDSLKNQKTELNKSTKDFSSKNVDEDDKKASKKDEKESKKDVATDEVLTIYEDSSLGDLIKDNLSSSVDTSMDVNTANTTNTANTYTSSSTSSNVETVSVESFQKAYSKLTKVAKDEGFDISNLDSDTLNTLVNDLQKLDSLDVKNTVSDKSLEKAISQFLNGQQNAVKDLTKSLSGNTQTTVLKGDPIEQELSSMLKDLNTSNIKVTDKIDSKIATEDFGAKDFEVIESSLKASAMLDDELSDIDTKSKIDGLMDGKEQASKDTLSQSLELLKKTSSGISQSEDILKNNRLDIGKQATVKENVSEAPKTLEEALTSTKSTAFGISSLQSSSNSQSENNSQNNSQNLFSTYQSAALKATKTDANATTTNNTRFDLLQLSSNLKENANAITQKVMEMSSRNLKSVDMDLNPEGLGKMKISIDVGADELAKISISASNSSTRALIEGGLDALKSSLKDANILADADVTDYQSSDDNSSNEQFSQGNNGQQSASHHGHEHQQNNSGTLFASNEKAVNVTENDPQEIDENINNSQNGNTVSYFA